MRNKLLTLSLLVVLSFTLTACTLQDLPLVGKFFGGGGGTNEPVTLTVWGLWENRDVMNGLIAKYQEAHPNVTINYDDRSILNLRDYKERVSTASSLDADMVLVHNTWVHRLEENLTPMPSGLMTVDAYKSTFYPVAADSGIANGNIYAVPFYYDGLVLLYNKNHFDEVGQQAAPTAWEEFRVLALKLTIRTGQGDTSGLVRAGAAIGNANNIEHFTDILGLMFAQTDVEVPNDIDSKPAADAVDFYTTFVKEDKVWDDAMPEAVTAFAQEKVSMIFVPTWRILEVIEANPTLDFGVAPVPQALPDSPVSYASFWMYVVPSSSKNSNVAWDFINFLSQDEQELALFEAGSKIRSFGVPYARASLGAEIQSHEVLGPLVSVAPYAKSSEIAARSGNDKAVDSVKAAINKILGGADTALTLTELKEGKL